MKTIFITGGSTGIGAASVAKFAREGWETANDGGTLVYICDYIFEYGELDDAVSANYARPSNITT